MLFGDSVCAAAKPSFLAKFAQLKDSWVFGHTPSVTSSVRVIAIQA
jgi:hypothetical protein